MDHAPQKRPGCQDRRAACKLSAICENNTLNTSIVQQKIMHITLYNMKIPII